MLNIAAYLSHGPHTSLAYCAIIIQIKNHTFVAELAILSVKPLHVYL